MIDSKNIGSDKAVQNPQQAVESAFGTYADPAGKLSDGDRFPNTSPGPDPKPFKSLRDA